MKLTRSLVCTTLLLTASSKICYGQTDSGAININVTAGRPLAAALAQIERRVGVAINYEDIPALDAASIKDVASQVMSEEQRKAHPDHHILVPKGGSLSWTGDVPASITVGGVTALVGSIVDANNAHEGLGKFAESFSNGAVFVVPTGDSVTAPSAGPSAILDTKVSFGYQQRTAAQTLDVILAALSGAAHANVQLGSAPFGLLVNSNVLAGADNEAARSVLGRLFASISSSTLIDGSLVARVGYALMYDPGFKFYALSIHTVLPVPRTDTVMMPGTQSAASSPYVRKR